MSSTFHPNILTFISITSPDTPVTSYLVALHPPPNLPLPVFLEVRVQLAFKVNAIDIFDVMMTDINLHQVRKGSLNNLAHGRMNVHRT